MGITLPVSVAAVVVVAKLCLKLMVQLFCDNAQTGKTQQLNCMR